jgi:aspartyl/asparaginyl beta-hydroxylase (cupin superfamily)
LFNDLLAKASFKLLMAMEQMNRRYSSHGNHAFFEPERFLWTGLVAARAAEIRAELDEVLLETHKLPNFQDISPDQVAITTDARWKTFFFKTYGVDLDKNLRRCPRTAEALEFIPGLTTAFFSILAPGKVIPPHRGPYNGVLRYHLGLRVPAFDETCAIRVNGEMRHWAEGKSLVFDDSFQHDAWNRTEHWRVVLFVDFMRPLPFFASIANRAMMAIISRTPFVRVAVKNLARWETTFYE